MRFGRAVGFVCVAVVAAAAYAAYRLDMADRWAPQAANAAHQWHDKIWPPQKEAAQSAKPAEPPPVAVAVAPARRADFPIILQGLGQVQAYNTVLVKARVDGQITKIGFKEGQMVKQGDLLAEIDKRPFQAALEQAQAKQTQDEANLANAKLDLGRYMTLSKQSFVTQQQLDTQKSLVNQLTAAIAADAAAVDAAQVQLNYATIRAPISGRVGFRLVDEGNLVSASQQTGIVSIAQLEPIAVIFTQPQDYLYEINAAMARDPLETIVSDTSGRKLATGKLIVSDNQVDASTGTIKLKAEFDNKDHALWPGQAVNVGLEIGVDRNALVVPAAAVQRGQNGLYVYVIDDTNHAVLRQVKVPHQNADTAVIAEGLKVGERVVTRGGFMLQPGAPAMVEAARGS